MVPQLAWRIFTGVSPKSLWKFSYNFGWKSMVNMIRFERRQKRKEAFFPAFMVISLTSLCNLSCQGCWVSWKKKQELAPEILEQIIRHCMAKGSYFFGLLGGEPLLYGPLLQVLKKFPSCYFQLFTNGILLTKEVARQLARLGNVTPLISIEGLEKVSDERRGGEGVYGSSIEGLENCIREKLLTGVAASICQSNFSELVQRDFVKGLIAKGAHYLWYYTYRPVGPNPCPELALRESQILDLRRFMVDIRSELPILVVDAYWDAKGQALCPGAMGISHHVSPGGHLEFCPPLQFAAEQLGSGSDFTEKMENSQFLKGLRERAGQSRGCIIQHDPQGLYQWFQKVGACDSSGRDQAYKELAQSLPCASHHIPGQEIPEKHWMYRLAKKYFFFGFGAYG